jgi:hypothetical protein
VHVGASLTSSLSHEPRDRDLATAEANSIDGLRCKASASHLPAWAVAQMACRSPTCSPSYINNCESIEYSIHHLVSICAATGLGVFLPIVTSPT